MNTTKSMTYAQTAHILPTKHGLNRYQSPCNLSLPLSQVAPSILSTLNSHIASQRLPKVQPLVMLELFDTAKIESVPSSAMAFHRRDWQGAYSGALAYGWDAHTDMSGATGDKAEQASDVGKVEEMREARTMIREMADAVAGRTPGEGAGEMTYGNYSESSTRNRLPAGIQSAVVLLSVVCQPIGRGRCGRISADAASLRGFRRQDQQERLWTQLSTLATRQGEI